MIDVMLLNFGFYVASAIFSPSTVENGQKIRDGCRGMSFAIYKSVSSRHGWPGRIPSVVLQHHDYW